MTDSQLITENVSIAPVRPGQNQVDMRIVRTSREGREVVALSVQLKAADYRLVELQRAAMERAREMLDTMLQHGLEAPAAPSAN